MVLFILILVGRAGGKTCYEYDTNTNTYKYEKNIKINWKLKFVLLDIYIFFLVGGGMEGVGGVGNMNQLYICIYTWRDTGIERDVVRWEGGGWVRYRYSYMGIGIGWNVLSLLKWEMWVSSLYRAWFGNLVGVRGVEKGLFLIRVQQHWKQKRKTKDTKEIYKKW